MKIQVNVYLTKMAIGGETQYSYTAVPSTRAGQADLLASETITGTAKSVDLLLSDLTPKTVNKWGAVVFSYIGDPTILAEISAAGKINPRSL